MMIIIFSITTVLTLFVLGAQPLVTNIEWLNILARYENELSIIIFSLGLLAYISVVSLRFYRPRNNRGGKWLSTKLQQPNRVIGDTLSLLAMKLQQKF